MTTIIECEDGGTVKIDGLIAVAKVAKKADDLVIEPRNYQTGDCLARYQNQRVRRIISDRMRPREISFDPPRKLHVKRPRAANLKSLFYPRGITSFK